MPWRVTIIILTLLSGMVSSSLKVGVEDRTLSYWSSDVVRSVNKQGGLSTENTRHTREEADNDTVHQWNCSQLYDSSYGYNESGCRFVKDNCQTKAHLFDYLAFIKCNMPQKLKVHWSTK